MENGSVCVGVYCVYGCAWVCAVCAQFKSSTRTANALTTGPSHQPHSIYSKGSLQCR